jgi:hypothetical protein
MFRKSLIILMVFCSFPLLAADREHSRHDSGRDISNISELFPTLDTLDCTPRCDGAPICGDFQEMNSCLDEGAAADCFWSCE